VNICAPPDFVWPRRLPSQYATATRATTATTPPTTGPAIHDFELLTEPESAVGVGPALPGMVSLVPVSLIGVIDPVEVTPTLTVEVMVDAKGVACRFKISISFFANTSKELYTRRLTRSWQLFVHREGNPIFCTEHSCGRRAPGWVSLIQSHHITSSVAAFIFWSQPYIKLQRKSGRRSNQYQSAEYAWTSEPYTVLDIHAVANGQIVAVVGQQLANVPEDTMVLP
jgi:hypothetical protein